MSIINRAHRHVSYSIQFAALVVAVVLFAIPLTGSADTSSKKLASTLKKQAQKALREYRAIKFPQFKAEKELPGPIRTWWCGDVDCNSPYGCSVFTSPVCCPKNTDNCRDQPAMGCQVGANFGHGGLDRTDKKKHEPTKKEKKKLEIERLERLEKQRLEAEERHRIQWKKEEAVLSRIRHLANWQDLDKSIEASADQLTTRTDEELEAERIARETADVQFNYWAEHSLQPWLEKKATAFNEAKYPLEELLALNHPHSSAQAARNLGDIHLDFAIMLITTPLPPSFKNDDALERIWRFEWGKGALPYLEMAGEHFEKCIDLARKTRKKGQKLRRQCKKKLSIVIPD